MLNQETHICRDYLEAVFDRATRPMEPVNFSPNVQDQPSRFKIFQGVNRFPLSNIFPTSLASMADVLTRITRPLDCGHREQNPVTKCLTFEELSTILQFSIGLLNRRLAVNWNRDERPRASYHQANNSYGRGTASGGGMYPTEIYWACGQSGPFLPGLYHYDPGHHALERLFTGDITRHIQTAVLDHPAATSTEQFLLLSLNFWKNAFKYSNFCYHVITEDLGALLYSLRLLALGFGSDLFPLLWYKDEALNKLLGLETLEESVFAVVPLSIAPGISPPSSYSNVQKCSGGPCGRQATSLPELDGPLFNKKSFQRSKEIIRFPLIENVHLATLIESEPRPDLNSVDNVTFVHGRGRACPFPETLPFPETHPHLETRSSPETGGYPETRPSPETVGSPETRPYLMHINGEQLDLPPPALDLLQSDLLQVFQKRQSSFGRFSRRKSLSQRELATLLYFGASACNYGADIKRVDGTPHFTRLVVFVNNVEGIEPGAFAYASDQHCLHPIHKGDLTHFLQENYLLQNYNLLETGALIAIVSSPDRLLEIYGNRGYRILNAEVGMIAQSIYMAAASMSFGCGAALGFNNRAMNAILGFEGTDQRTILFLLAGHERQGNANFDFRLT